MCIAVTGLLGGLMDAETNKAKEIEEISKRIEYLITSNQISSEEKQIIIIKALEIIKNC